MNTSASSAESPEVSAINNLLNIKQQAIVSAAAEQTVKQLKNTDGGDVKGIASAQISLLSNFYDLSLDQARRSFRWALVASIIGFCFFLAAIAFLTVQGSQGTDMAIVSVIGGAMTQFIAGVNFFLYGRTLNQLTVFQERLENTQRFLLANSLCENLNGKLKDYSRARLIGTLAGIVGGDIDRAWVTDELGQADTVRDRHEVTNGPIAPAINEPVAMAPTDSPVGYGTPPNPASAEVAANRAQ